MCHTSTSSVTAAENMRPLGENKHGDQSKEYAKAGDLEVTSRSGERNATRRIGRPGASYRHRTQSRSSDRAVSSSSWSGRWRSRDRRRGASSEDDIWCSARTRGGSSSSREGYLRDTDADDRDAAARCGRLHLAVCDLRDRAVDRDANRGHWSSGDGDSSRGSSWGVAGSAHRRISDG